MVDDFDAYRKWLGIPPKEQPPHHYRLLGIAPFEDDADVIQNAADRQMAHIRTFQTGKHGAQSQKLLNELSVARGCLLDRDRKAEYDAGLRLKLNSDHVSRDDKPEPAAATIAPPRPAPPRAIRPPVAPPAAAPLAVAALAPVALESDFSEGDVGDEASAIALPTPSVRRAAARRAAQQNTVMPLMIGGAAIGVLVLFAVAFLASRGKTPTNDEPTKTADTLKKPEVKPPASVANVPPKPVKVEPPRPRETRPESRPEAGRPAETANSNLPSSPKFGEPTSSDSFTPPPAGGDRVSVEIAAVRAALGRRDIEDAKRHLIEAEYAAKDDSAKERVAHVKALCAYLEEFWAAVRQGVFKMKPGETARSIFNSDFEFEKVEGEMVSYKSRGQNHNDRISNVRTSAAVVFAKKVLGESDHAQYCVVAFLLLDQPGGNRGFGGRGGMQQELTRRARQLYEETSRRGKGDPVLEKEIRGSGDMPAIDLSSATPNSNSPDSLPEFEPAGGVMPETEISLPAASIDRRTPVPDEKSLGEARKRLLTKFSAVSDRNRTAEQKVDLAKHLRSEAAGATSDPPLQFVLLEKARDLAGDGGKPELMVEMIDELGKTFAIDVFREKSVALNKFFLANNGADQAAAIHTLALGLFRDAQTAKRYEAAEMLGDLAQRTARKANDQAAVKLIGEQIILVKKLGTEATRLEQALARLKADPADAPASTFAGRHYCFVDDNWRAGLPLLAKGNEGELKDTAAADVANPAAASDQVALADRWFKLGRAATDETRAPLLRRAKHWFELALPQLSGAEKTVAEERLKEIEALAPVAKL